MATVKGGGSALPNGRSPEPGDWNRFDRLRNAGVHFRSGVIEGVGGSQALVEDPPGNLIELFQPIVSEARLGSR